MSPAYPGPAMDALQRVYEEEYPRLCVLAARVLGRDDLARDTVHTAWLRLAEAAERRGLDVSDPEKLRHLAAMTVKHTALNLCRRERRTQADDDFIQCLSDPAPGPDGTLERREAVLRLRRELAALPVRDRAILLYRYGYGCTSDQIAALLGMQPAAVRQRAHRLCRKLKEKMEGVL